MENKKILLFSGLAVFFLLAAGIIMSNQQPNNSQINMTDGDIGGNKSANGQSFMRTSDGRKYTVHPDNLIQGCPGMDCIPSVDDPSFETAEEAQWLEENDRIIGLEINGDARAYPLNILSRHEIVNDNVGGEPVAVTYCPLCRSGVTYFRELNGEILEFGVSGKLHNANLVMYDRSSETYWNQISGKAIVGEKVPQELNLLFSSITTWSEWKEGHPETRVLSRNTGIYPASTYETGSYQSYKNSERVGFGVEEFDERLPSKELVHGIRIANESKAYPEKVFEQKGLVEDQIKDKKVILFKKPVDGAVIALITHQTDTKFQLNQENITDSNGDAWSFEGEQINGNGSMRQVVPQGFYWFAWSKFNPDTQIYKSRTG